MNSERCVEFAFKLDDQALRWEALLPELGSEDERQGLKFLIDRARAEAKIYFHLSELYRAKGV